jgi:signal transduction histidine kinase
VRLPEFRKSSIYRLTAIYMLCFGLSALIILAVVYGLTIRLIDQQMHAAVAGELEVFADMARADGLPSLMEAVDRRAAGSHAWLYLIVDAQKAKLAGNLAAWPEILPVTPGQDQIVAGLQSGPGDLDETPSEHLLMSAAVADGDILLIGQRLDERHRFQEIMKSTALWTIASTLALGAIGGGLTARYPLRRVEAIVGSSDKIVAGALDERLPVSRSGDEVDRLSIAINRMLDRIDHLISGLRIATESLAHDLRSPLTRTKSTIELALRGNHDADSYVRALHQASDEIDLIIKTLGALLSIAEAEAGEGRTDLAPLDLSALVRDLAQIYQPIAEASDLDFQAEIVPQVRISGHRELLGQALANLLDNAMKYTPPGGGIVLAVERDGDRIGLSVADTGPGIPPAEYHRVVQRFVRLEADRRTPGSGLGLNLAAAVAKLHGGSLTLADNHPGLRVTIVLQDSL